MSAVVSIVGRPNVGKSTLFNRLIGKRRAIESDVPGTTRDRLYDKVMVEGHPIILVDTGGLETKAGSDIEANVQEQSAAAIAGSDIIVFVVDVREELTAEDFHAATLLRKSKKPVILVANKCDNPKFEELRFNMFELGFGEPVALTALHSFGIDELESRVAEQLKKLGFEKGEVEAADDNRIKIAFLGRPNVGKSTLVNALFGKKMVVVSDVPGTTRDSTEIPFEYKDTAFTLIDTAGIRRRGKIEPGLEKYSILRSMGAVELADICVLLIDATEGVTKQDCHVSEYILEQKKGLILVVNKMDLYEGKEREDREHMLVHDLQNTMAYLPWAPVIFGSGLERRNIFPVLDLAIQVTEERNRIVPAQDLRVWLSQAVKKHPPRGSRGKHRFNVLSVEQVDILPPTFVFYCDWPEIMHFSYGRFLENELRSQFGFNGTSLRMLFRKPGERGPKHKRKGALDAEKPEEFTVIDDGIDEEQ
ncbi:MAG: ribosome biogenesis GTPase Der [Patescibacteria group bacterium]